MTVRTRNLLIGAVVVVVVVIVSLVATHSGHKASSSASPTTTARSSVTTSGASSSTTAAVGSGPAPTTVTPSTNAPSGATTTTQPMPLQIKVSSTRGLRDGSVVTVTITADKGSEYYGLDARLCAATPTTPAITNLYNYIPDPAGYCILKPLSADSDAYLEAGTAPPNQTGTINFRVGVGTNTFTTENLQKVSITCGPGHPCQLVIRPEYPYGFGFRSIPLDYAG
jgi:hypothetical protein